MQAERTVTLNATEVNTILTGFAETKLNLIVLSNQVTTLESAFRKVVGATEAVAPGAPPPPSGEAPAGSSGAPPPPAEFPKANPPAKAKPKAKPPPPGSSADAPPPRSHTVEFLAPSRAPGPIADVNESAPPPRPRSASRSSRSPFATPQPAEEPPPEAAPAALSAVAPTLEAAGQGPAPEAPPAAVAAPLELTPEVSVAPPPPVAAVLELTPETSAAPPPSVLESLEPSGRSPSAIGALEEVAPVAPPAPEAANPWADFTATSISEEFPPDGGRRVGNRVLYAGGHIKGSAYDPNAEPSGRDLSGRAEGHEGYWVVLSTDVSQGCLPGIYSSFQEYALNLCATRPQDLRPPGRSYLASDRYFHPLPRPVGKYVPTLSAARSYWACHSHEDFEENVRHDARALPPNWWTIGRTGPFDWRAPAQYPRGRPSSSSR